MKTYDDDAEKKDTKENRIISGVAIALAFAVTTAGIVLTNNKEPVVDAKQNPKEITVEPAAKKDSVSSISFEAVHKMYQNKTR